MSGVYCFDLWVKECRNREIKISLQMHDEMMFYLKIEDRDKCRDILNKSMEKVNEIVKLNVPLSVSVDFGSNYAEVH